MSAGSRSGSRSEGPDRARVELEHIAHVEEHWEQFGPGAVGIGWDLGLVGLAIHLSPERRSIPRSGSSGSPPTTAAGSCSSRVRPGSRPTSPVAPTGLRHAKRPIVARRRTWQRHKLEHVLASSARRRYSQGDARPDTCPDCMGDPRPRCHRKGADLLVGRQEVDPDARRSLCPRCVHVSGAARRFRRRHLTELRGRDAARSHRARSRATASTPSFWTAPAPGCTTSAWR